MECAPAFESKYFPQQLKQALNEIKRGYKAEIEKCNSAGNFGLKCGIGHLEDINNMVPLINNYILKTKLQGYNEGYKQALKDKISTNLDNMN